LVSAVPIAHRFALVLKAFCHEALMKPSFRFDRARDCKGRILIGARFVNRR
jgi:hypothetical protein